jgi:hypothetical protein
MRSASIFLLVLLVTFPAYAAEKPASRPATLPAKIDLRPFEDRVEKAKEDLAKATAEARIKWESSETYKSLRATVDKLLADLNEARAGTDPQRKLNASAAYNNARLKLEKEEKAAMDVAKQAGELKVAEDQLKIATTENAKRQTAADDADPIRQAMRKKTLAKGMTKEQVLQIFEYVDQTVQTENGERVTFIEEADLPRTAYVTFVNGKVTAFTIETKRLSDFKPTPVRP